jgi:hypothetical protein
MPKARKPRRRRVPHSEAEHQAEAPFADRILTEALAKAIAAVQSQKVPAEAAVRSAMEGLGAAQRGVLELSLQAAKAQAELVHRVLAKDPRLSILGEEVGSLLANAVESGLEFLDTLGSTLTSAAASPPQAEKQNTPSGPPVPTPGPTEEQQIPPSAVSDSTPPSPTPEEQPTPESQLMDVILPMIADGYSAGEPGDAVAHRICTAYPAVVPTIRQYLAMDDFLVLMWMRQQPALAQIAASDDFPRFYAQLKTGFEQIAAGA